MTLDLSTEYGVLSFARRQREEMRRDFERLGRFERNGFSFVAFAFATHDVERVPGQSPPFITGDKHPAVKAVPVIMPEFMSGLLPREQLTAAFAHVLREFCKTTRAIGTLLMSEMWMGSLVGEGKMSREQAERERAARPASIEDWDDRREGLMMSLEHAATGRHVWMAMIERKPTRLAPWQETHWQDAEGRLVDLSEFRS